MKKILLAGLVIGLCMVGMVAMAEATPVKYTISGDLGDVGGDNYMVISGSMLIDDTNIQPEPSDPFSMDALVAKYTVLNFAMLIGDNFTFSGDTGYISFRPKESALSLQGTSDIGYNDILLYSSISPEMLFDYHSFNIGPEVHFLTGIGNEWGGLTITKNNAVVPEPATILLLGIGLAGFRRRLKKT